mmetsp:Transcript_8987/g.14287  ORF Transcript_8987/g.14287 Transcript_8987/m.14287 type:complete len:297 (-) Transcript_8987:425-1315(-)
MRQERNPPQMSSPIWKKVSKNWRVPLMSSSISVSAPKHMKVRIRSSSSGQMDRHTFSAMASASTSAAPPDAAAAPVAPSMASPPCSSWARESTSRRTESKVFDTMNPVDGCTIPAVPPTPSTRCGRVGSTPPMGIKQYSSSSTRLTLMPRDSRRCCSFTLRSSNSSPGRSTRDVSSKKIFRLVNGMAYKNVGWSLFASFFWSSRCWSRQSMNSMVSSGNPCGSSVSHIIPNAAWYPGVKSRSNSTSFRACPVASRTILECTLWPLAAPSTPPLSARIEPPFSCVTLSTAHDANTTP